VESFQDLQEDTTMVNRRTPLWKKISALLLHRRAVRVLWVGPETPLDPRVEDAKKRGDAQPMPPELLEAIKGVIELVPRKQELWSQVKQEADAQMSRLWTKLWATARGKDYVALKEELDRRKKKLDAEGRRLEDGIWTKLVAGGRQLTYLKTHVVATSEEQIREATAAVEQAKVQLQEAKAKLKQLQRAKTEAVERVNVLLVEDLKGPPTRSRAVPVNWSARSSADTIERAIMEADAIDALLLEPLEEMDVALDGMGERLDALVGAQPEEDDFTSVVPVEEDAVV
jgi:hypothetical protein